MLIAGGEQYTEWHSADPVSAVVQPSQGAEAPIGLSSCPTVLTAIEVPPKAWAGNPINKLTIHKTASQCVKVIGFIAPD